ncbi:MAG: uL15 family ribosomal protein [Candidatus Aenigmarchaeota archaeon]|nr:uL15 family ribosomal protein [Candidatus Aenigmarchaeota archaeon]
MVVHHRKKIRRQRGYRSHGYGSKKKHRGKGSRGGRGYGGSHKHKYSYIIKYEPDHYGSSGFRSLKKKDKEINIDTVLKLMAGKDSIDLGEHGFTKLLSKGEISKPIAVKVAKSSAAAKEKIEKAGGSVEETKSAE